ncbi:hypothetical protein HK097_007879 [Rhizophlyctis rosea]|uniref:chitin synthase n=1 Tax=Rhizophlyctis rosea TaxID=64517 RepID=A0AAD5X5K5_9FUNG|nr:hypothetical protein HK097_007879 [Rhizophlyctis rosea]
MSSRKSSSAENKEDLVLLGSTREEDIITNIRDRYARNQVFTRIGATTVLAVNPVKTLESFSDNTSNEYAKWAKDTSEDKQPLPAHIFDLAASAFNHMLRNQQDQSIIFSGETGSGKSEMRKLLVRQLCALGKTSKKKSKVISGAIKSETVLEAFGNARTASNPNSSRFGRYTEYQFDSKGKMVGAKMLDYLLEKSRVTQMPTNERNFHIFYYILAGATPEERTQWRLNDGADFAYLGGSRQERGDDTIRFGELRDHLKSLGVGRRLQSQMYQLMAAILHLGNVVFQDDPEHPQEPCTVKNHQVVELVAELLGVAAHNLEYALTYKTKLVRKDLITVFLNAEDAAKQRDSLARTLFSLVFGWLVEHINTRLCKDDCENFVGVVDLSGFQNYRTNRLEQFLYNYANERLNQFAASRVFELYDEYLREGVRSARPAIRVNDATVKLIGGEAGLISVLNTVCGQTPARTDEQFVEHLVDTNSNHASFIASGSTSAFAIRHYAGDVTYDAIGFIERNNDSLAPDFVSIFRGNGNDIPSSANGFLRDLFSEKVIATESQGRDRGILTSAQQPQKPTRQPSLKRRGTKTEEVTAPTVAVNFRVAIDEMVDTLAETIPWFVLCVKPNEDVSSDRFDAEKVSKQLRALDAMSLVQARAASDWTVSYTFDEFLSRYAAIVDPMRLDESGGPSGRCEDFVIQSKWTSREMAIGRNKVFIAEGAWRSLEDELQVIEEEQKDMHAQDPRSSLDEKIPRSSFGSGSRGFTSMDESRYSSDAPYEEDGSYYDDSESHYESDFGYDARQSGTLTSRGQSKDIELKRVDGSKKSVEGPNVKIELPEEEEEHKNSAARKKWLCCTWMLTWWAWPICLSGCGGMKRKDVQMAWREKVALCMIILVLCGALLFFIIGLGRIICPRQNVLSEFELASKTSNDDPWVWAYGRAYEIKKLVEDHVPIFAQSFQMSNFFGQDVSKLFFKNRAFDRYCPGLTEPAAGWDNLYNRGSTATTQSYYPHWANDSNGNIKQYLEYMNQYTKSRVAFRLDYIADQASNSRRLLIIHNNVYDVSAYFNSAVKFFTPEVEQIFYNYPGKDATAEWKSRVEGANAENARATLRCMNEMFYVGTVDLRNTPQCQFSNYVLLAATILIVSVIGFKFLAALQFGSSKDPEEHDKFVICQVPCYTEGVESLSKTLESLAVLRYDDKRKLLFIICDGMIIGGGNDRPTPRIVLDILGVDPNYDPEPLSFQSLGEGDKQHNMGKVYSGLYEIQGRQVPYIVVVKVGKPSERSRPGNRGKRDSQMVLMRFLNRVHFNSGMNPLELELYHHMKNIIGVNPSFYEYILMVDADTEVHPLSLNRMISSMIHDSKIMGLCGETLLSNEKSTWITMIQVYEYFISHHLAKAFESLFGSVTCLPGCFCMYRVRTPTKNVPLLIAPAMIEDYSENRVETLHMKNLLHLGEDRYLTTLMMKHFPNLKLTFTSDAVCTTTAPDRWSVLLSQRRRWINSTVHNLLELLFLPHLCGFCCFSMRFVVFLDLFSTIVQPAALLYIIYLVYSAIDSTEIFPLMSVIMMAAIYGLQVIIFILKRQWAQIGWMVVYILAMPVFSFYIPMYAFWHFDDFSWGNTRVVMGDKGQKIITADVVKFDPKSIPLKKWSDHEQEIWEKNSSLSDSNGSHHSGDSKRYQAPSVYGGSQYTSVAPSVYSSPSVYAASAAPSVYSGYGAPPSPGSVYGGSVVGSVAPGQRLPAYPESRPSFGNSTVVPGPQTMLPSDDVILREVRRVLSTADLMTITKKQVRDDLSVYFGVDLTPKKGVINQFIEEILQGRL